MIPASSFPDILTQILCGLALAMAGILLIHLRSPLGWFILFPKLVAGALSPIWLAGGMVGTGLAFLNGQVTTAMGGMLGSIIMISYIRSCTRSHRQLAPAFGEDLQEGAPPLFHSAMLIRRWPGKLNTPPETSYVWQRDLPFWTFTKNGRTLLCDLWRPSRDCPNGVILIYCHGSGWWAGDKDFQTRPYFRHLVAQGYTVMDVAYRLCPEVDIHGMVGDVKRAVNWAKDHAEELNVDPDKIVLAGGSAGGHLALQAAYTPDNHDLNPPELAGKDLRVAAAISCYAPTDLVATYRHTGQKTFTRRPSPPVGPEAPRRLRDVGRLDTVMGGEAGRGAGALPTRLTGDSRR